MSPIEGRTMTDIRIGTSGYDYTDWKGTFYPQQVARKDFLAYYAQQFSTLELNFSYYRMPEAAQLQRMAEACGPDMDISIKAHQSLTHDIDPPTWDDSVTLYRRAVEPLLRDGRLAAVLLQFPYSFHYEPDNRRYLDKVLRALGHLPLVVEFRNDQWLNNRVFDGLRARGAGFCCVDAPALKGLPPSLDMVTADIAYVRFHGRNAKQWWGSDAAARFDYLYSPEELAGYDGRVQAMMQQAKKIRLYFNNHRRGQAPANALWLQEHLRSQQWFHDMEES